MKQAPVCSLAQAIIFLTGEIEMNTLRRFVPAVVLGLTIAMAGVSAAQNANQTADSKQSCCCMTSGCCSDTCPMMKKDAMKNHATSSDKHGGCGCCGDSCPMMKKNAMKNHTSSSDKDGCCCCGDSCDMKKAAKTSGTTPVASAKHDCCCRGDSCDLKDMKNMKDMREKP
jgi:hypothetical protein